MSSLVHHALLVLGLLWASFAQAQTVRPPLAPQAPVAQAVTPASPSERQAPAIPSITAASFLSGKDAKANSFPLFQMSIGDSNDPTDLVPALRVVAILTLLTFAPAILLLMTAFTRIMIVLSFLRQALGAPTMPPNQGDQPRVFQASTTL